MRPMSERNSSGVECALSFGSGIVGGSPLLPVYDGEMRRRVDARRYPSITAVLTSLRAGSPAGRYVAEGDVTFRGVTRRVTGDLTISPAGPGALRFEGEHVFNLRDFGMEPPRILMLRVFPEVTVRVRVVMTAGD